MPTKSSAIESYEEIRKILEFNKLKDDAYVQRKCFQKVDGLKDNLQQCWCKHAGPNGIDLSCP